LTKGDVPYLTFERLGMRSFAPDPRPEEVAMRQAQLAMRGAEIDECLHVLRRIAGGEGEQVARESTRGLANKLSSGAAKRERRRRRGNAPRGPEASLEGAPERLAEWRDKL
jgi:platelet-activating factor acetylhydrolase